MFFTSVQKYCLWITCSKFCSVACTGNHDGVTLLLISSFVLKDVEIIQKTGKTITAKMARPSDVPAELAREARAHATSAVRTIRRT